MGPTDYLVDQLLSEQLRDNPCTRAIYNTDAMFHASVKLLRTTLITVAEEMSGAAMIAPGQVRVVLQATLDRMLSDDVLDQHDAIVKAATRPLYDSLVARRLPGGIDTGWAG